MSDSSPISIRRAPRTYGKPRNTASNDTSFDGADTSFGALTDPDSSIDNELPPASDGPDAFDASTHGVDASNSDDDDRPSAHRWSWQKKLDEIDEGKYDSAAPTASTVLTTHGDYRDVQDTRSASRSNLDPHMSGSVFSGSFPSLVGSSPLRSAATPPPSALTPIDSSPAPEPESDHDSHRPSTPQSSPGHPIGTPTSRSSPTPPTSIEMSPKKGKGKERAVEPLELNSAGQGTGTSKPSTGWNAGGKGKKKGAGRIKAPTKKEHMETQKATARIAAAQHVAVPRAQNTKQYSVTDLFKRIIHQAPQPKSPPRNIPSSDPIETSSPLAEQSAPSHKAPVSLKGPPKNVAFVANGLLEEAESEEENLPDGLQMIEQKNNADMLLKKKQDALAQQQRQPRAEDDGSDLEIADDPESVLREEGQARRATQARGIRPSKGRANQLAYTSPSARRKSLAIPTDEVESRRLLRVSATSAFESSSSKGAKPPRLSQDDLNKILLQRNAKQAQQADRAKQEDWKRRGGRVKEQAETAAVTKSAAELLQEIQQKRQAAAAHPKEIPDDDSSDEDWKPEENAGEAEGSDREEEGEQGPMQVDLDDQADDEGDEDEDDNPFIDRPRRPMGGRGRSRVVAIQSDEEDNAENQPPPGRVLVEDTPAPRQASFPAEIEMDLGDAHRNSVSSDGNRTEDGTDKENDVWLSFDRGEDKENTKVHSPMSAMSLRLGRSFSSLFGAEGQASPVGSVGRGGADGVRSPLVELPKEDEDDPFALSLELPSRLGRAGGMASLETSPMDLGEGTGLDLQPAFSLKGKGKERARDASPLGAALDLGGGFGGGGLSQFATQAGDARGFDQLKGNDDIDLTPEPGLQAALDVSNTFRRKADEIFAKEQAAVVEEILADIRRETAPETFVNFDGFLTQTRPTTDVSPVRPRSPARVLFTPAPAFKFHSSSSPRSGFTSSLSSLSSLSASVRKPLAPIPSQDPDEDDLPDRKRLHKRTVSVSPERVLGPLPKLPNAFDVLGKRTSPKRKRPLRSEYVEGEAEESDDDAGFGFGVVKKADEEEEEDGEDQDQHLADLVDDKEMDAETLAESVVMEKVREHEELDDKALEKVAMDLARGDVRRRRRNHGVGVDSDDSDEEDVRRPRPKRVRIENDNIAALAKNAETEAFAREYRAQIEDDDNEFAHLNRASMELDLEQPDEEHAGEERETVSMAQLDEELRQVFKQKREIKAFNPRDTSWIADGDDDEMEEEPRVREVSNEAVPARRPHADEPTQHARMWAKREDSSRRTAAVAGRGKGGSAAVTGHGKPKAGAGSFKAPRATASSTATAKPSRISKEASVLSAVSSRRDKFSN